MSVHEEERYLVECDNCADGGNGEWFQDEDEAWDDFKYTGGYEIREDISGFYVDALCQSCYDEVTSCDWCGDGTLIYSEESRWCGDNQFNGDHEECIRESHAEARINYPEGFERNGECRGCGYELEALYTDVQPGHKALLRI